MTGEGILFDQFRKRKLLDYYLEPVAQKNGLLLSEVRLILHLYLSGSNTRRALADFAGLTKGSLSVQLQRLAGKGLVSVTETHIPDSREKTLQISFPPAAETVLAELENALKDFEAARVSGFGREERAQYEQLSRHIQENIRDILQ